MDLVPAKLFQLALQSADLGVWMLDLEHDDETLRSLRHDQMFGYQTLQPRWGLVIALEHIVEEDRHILAEAFETALTTGALSCEFRVQWPDGSVHWIAPLGRTEFSPDGRPLRVCGVVADVTARKHMEAEALQRNKMAAIGELTAGIAHDFNNVLQGVAASFELIARFIENDNASEAAARARRGNELVARAARMTHRLLAFSRRSPLAPGEVDLAKRLPDITSMMRPTADHNIELAVVVEPDLPAIRVDDAQFEAALLNLLFNARDASVHGGRIEVRAHRAIPGESSLLIAADHPGFALVEVVDNGTGIPSEILKRAFEPFFTTKPVGAGTGLGLSQVYGFVHQSGGEVQVDSVVGAGTRVRVWLPFEASQVRQESEAACVDVPTTNGLPAPSTSTGRILLVDDEPEVRDAICTLLQQAGHEVVIADDADSALMRLHETPGFALMVSDIGLNGAIDGCELVHRCRQLHPQMPVLLITGYAGEDLQLRLLAKTPVLVKPFDMQALSEAVSHCLTTGVASPGAVAEEALKV